MTTATTTPSTITRTFGNIKTLIALTSGTVQTAINSANILVEKGVDFSDIMKVAQSDGATIMSSLKAANTTTTIENYVVNIIDSMREEPTVEKVQPKRGNKTPKPKVETVTPEPATV